jgi:hypothetical protein
MKIKAGGRYRRRDGVVVEAQTNPEGGRYAFSARGWTYDSDGRHMYTAHPHVLDLIEEVGVDDAPAVASSAPEIAQENRNDSNQIANVDNPRRATEIAARAAKLVGGDRDRQHGAKGDNFRRIATMWNAWLAVRKDRDAPLDAHDVGVLMVLMKAARTQSGALNIDDYVDGAGYMACAGEVALDAAKESA